MKPTLIVVVLFVVGVVMADRPNVWPMPAQMSSGSNQLSLPSSSGDLQVVAKSGSAMNGLVNQAIQRFKSTLYPSEELVGEESIVGIGQISEIEFFISDNTTNLQFDMDEGYTLSVGNDGSVSIESSNVFGFMYALTTFTQLVDGNKVLENVPVEIKDSPRFPHRGLLIDSARHYLPLATILGAVDGCVQNKLNVLHWHIVDAQSFPYDSKALPLISKGAWTPSLKYSIAEVQQVINYAWTRGVRVLLEFDQPGHAYSWGIGYPDATVKCPKYAANINNIPLDPTSNFTYSLVQKLINEVSGIVMDDMIHLGGDETVYGCWGEDPAIMEWMEKHNVKTFDDLFGFYVNNVHTFMSANKKTPVYWEEVFLSGKKMFPEDIVHVWKDSPTLEMVAKAGIRTLMSFGWYLDHLQDDWTTFYLNEPIGSNWSHETAKYVIGGEACMWGEHVDGSNFEQRVWPRAAATAERLWSPKEVNSTTEALPRLLAHRCRMLSSGIASAPIQPGFC